MIMETRTFNRKQNTTLRQSKNIVKMYVKHDMMHFCMNIMELAIDTNHSH